MGQYSFKLPDVGEGTVQAEIIDWRVKVGERVEEDQPLVDVMTDKATVELTSPVAGIVRSTAGQVGEMAAVGSVLVVLEITSVEAPVASVTEASTPAAAAIQPVAAVVVEPEYASSLTPSGRAAAAPAVRRRAEQLGVDLRLVRGSGPEGRINHADLDALLTNGSDALARQPRISPVSDVERQTGVEEIPVTGLRRQIAERMQLAKRQIPHFSYVEEVDVTELENLRARLNAGKDAAQPKLTLLPFIIRAMVHVLPSFPQINAIFDDQAGVVRRHSAVHVGIATQTPRGLMVTVIHQAQTRDLWNCAAEIRRLAEAARDGKATREDLTGSTITITSLGPLGGVVTTPVINRPEVAIVGPNKIVERMIVRSGEGVVRKMMNLSSSFDHRVVDGAEAAEFIQQIRVALEHPATLFIR